MYFVFELCFARQTNFDIRHSLFDILRFILPPAGRASWSVLAQPASGMKFSRVVAPWREQRLMVAAAL